MPRLADTIDLSAAERRDLERLKRATSTPQSLACRARMILLAGDGVNVVETAERLGVWRKTVSRWRARWRSADFAFDNARRGKCDLQHTVRQRSGSAFDNFIAQDHNR